jgi:predicted Ser/Thr protein kinase
MLRAGTQIGSYVVDGVIGQGGMGVVYRASQASLTRVVALKLLNERLSSDDRFRERFRREATFQAAIEHPNIVPIYEASDSQHGLFIAMRLVLGPNLQELIRANDVAPDQTLRILDGVAGALDTAHAQGVIHRDVKPANILVVSDHAYLADFGLTKAVGEESITSSGPLLGTLDYVAPEQIRGEEIDARADVYALGAVLFECLTGTVPFKRATDVAVLYAHLEQKPPSVRELRRELPRAVDHVIRRAMSKDPSKRQESAGQVMTEAAAALDEARQRGRHPRQPPPPAGETSALPVADEASPLRRWAWRRRAPRLVPLTVPLAVLVGLAVGLWAPASKPALATERVIEASTASMRVPHSWTVRPPGSPIRYLFYRDSASRVPPGVAGASPPGLSDAGALIGRVSALGPDLLPGAIHTDATFSRASTAVRLHNLQALYYSGVRTKDRSRSIELYLVPTTNNVVGVACYGPVGRSDGGALEDCGQIAATLHLIASHAFSLDARPGYTSLLARVLGSLARRVPGRLHTLFIAPTSVAQTAAARQLAAAYRHAAAQLTGLPFGTISPAEGGITILVRDSLLGVANAFDGLAAAAARRDASSYNSAGAEIRTAVNGLGASLAQLTKLGYLVS